MEKSKFIKLIFLIDNNYLSIYSDLKNLKYNHTIKNIQFKKKYNMKTKREFLYFQFNYLLFIYMKYLKKSKSLIFYSNNRYGLSTFLTKQNDDLFLAYQDKIISGYVKSYSMTYLYIKNKDIFNFQKTNISFLFQKNIISYFEKVHFTFFKNNIPKPLMEFNSFSVNLNCYFFFFWINFFF